ncbi:hypothetical protein KSS87_002279, partial [Heliosperma pusillum]
MPEVCHLTVPTGKTHQVALVEEDSKLWFQDGWEQFMDCFSIGYGYFMVFTYNGNSNFKVNVFDLTACEISYQCDEHTNSHSPVQNGPNNSEELCSGNDDENIVVENLHSPPACPRESAVEVLELNSEDDVVESKELSETSADTGDESDSSQFGSKFPIWLTNYKEEIKGLAAAGISIPSNPFFVARIKAYALHRGRFL